MIDLGTDFAVLSSMESFGLITGPTLVLDGVYRRWTTHEDSLAGRRIYKGRCRDIRRLLGARFDSARLVALGQELADVARDDERVEDCAALLEGDRSQKIIRLRGEVKVVGESTALEFVVPFDTFNLELLNAR